MDLLPARGRRLAAAALLAGAAALGTAACTAAVSDAGRDTGQASRVAAPASMEPGMAMGAAPSTASASHVTVHITGSAYSDPGPVAPGAVVTVMNMDSRPHTVTADDGSFDSVAQPGQSVSFTAPMRPGTYPYHCRYHSDMHSALIVR